MLLMVMKRNLHDGLFGRADRHDRHSVNLTSGHRASSESMRRPARDWMLAYSLAADRIDTPIALIGEPASTLVLLCLLGLRSS
jgi:hypothetical protein